LGEKSFPRLSQTYHLFARRYPGTTSHVPFLAPWWGAPNEDANSLHRGQFAAWAATKPAAYVLVDDPAKADVFILSIPWKLTRNDPAARAFADAEILDAKKRGRSIVIFFDSDHDDAIDWPEHTLVFRFSIYRDTRRRNEFSIPTFSQDFLALTHGGVLRTREKPTVPSVGFCGYAPPLGCRWSKRTLQEIFRYAAYRVGVLARRRHLIAHAPRVQALRVLQRTSGVESRFIVRDQFAFNRWGVLQPGGTPESAARQRAEFIANLDESDYTVCARGLANCSIRFYEAISLGRLPLFIDTQCVLPYDWIVDWKAIGVWVDETELAKVGKILREHHARCSPTDYITQQRSARELFETWISPEGFFGQLHRHFPVARPMELKP
jgi:hypothetical protein